MMISNSTCSSRSRRIFTAALVTSLGFGVVLTSAAQSTAPAALAMGAAIGGSDGVRVSAGTSANSPASASLVPSIAKEESAPKPSGGMNQGIMLHGHWTINVKNPDGTQVQHHEFENQLQYDGTQFLTGLLSGYGVAGDYAIYFTNATAQATGSASTNVVCPAPASTTTSTFPYCSIVQNVNSQPGIFHCLHYVCVSGLTATPTFGSGTGLPNFTLMGSITAPQAGAVVNVYVGFNGCNIASTATPPTPTSPGSITATACETQTTGSYGGTLSGTTITPITVVAGQIIQITVTYTFS
jgi:hypothetical protein